MLKVKIKKIIKKKESMMLIEDLSRRLKTEYAICEGEKILFGNCEEYERFSSREFEGVDESVLFYGGDNSDIVYNLIKELINQEVEKKRLAHEVLDKYKELTIFYTLAQKIAACSDIKQISRIVYSEIVKFIQASDMMLVMFHEEDEDVSVILDFPNENGAWVIDPYSQFVEKVIALGEAQIFNEVGKNHFGGEDKLMLRSIICAPIVIKNKVQGLGIIGNRNDIIYTAEDLKLFNAAIFQLAVAIENARLYNVMEDAFFQTVRALSETIEKRDPYTSNHTYRVMDLAVAMGNEIGLGKDELVNIRLAALMHDIGKVGIEDKILRKPDKLTFEEFEQMKKHTLYGAEILQNIKQLERIIDGVKSHHERYDGKGYPEGLKGEEIPILGRILSVSDSFDAMVSDRPYRKGMDVKVAVEELTKNAGTQFDPEIIRVFLELYENNKVRVEI